MPVALDPTSAELLLERFGELFDVPGPAGVVEAHRSQVHKLLERQDGIVLGVREPRTLPVVAHLDRALAAAAPEGLAEVLLRVAPHLTWEHGYASIPAELVERYGYCEIVGPNGPIVDDLLIIGLVLFAPTTHYPRHRHAGITETYVSISGAWTMNDSAQIPTGRLVTNPPGTEHEIRVGPGSPCLLVYAWTADAGTLASFEMTFD